jgi:hypothetical protein
VFAIAVTEKKERSPIISLFQGIVTGITPATFVLSDNERLE